MLSVERIERGGAGAMLYDGSLVNHITEAWFDPARWPSASRAPGRSGGRGATLFIECDGRSCVLRHYYRGGAAARFSRDRFIWLGEARVRSFAEWRLLARMVAAGLPVPRPLAARYVRTGVLYQADLVTLRIPDVVALATRLERGPVDDSLWRRVGECIGRFHAARVFHADLNAYNLQVNSLDEVFLLDFDRGRIMPAHGEWQRRNLARLHRSLIKVRRDGAGFDEAAWAVVLDGYGSTVTLG